MIKFIKNLLKKKVEKNIQPVYSRRFPFGEILENEGKTYRYLYSYGDDDVFMRDDENPRIFFIKSKHIEP